MYEALVARVRYHIQKAIFMGPKDAESTQLLNETADAIEELSREIDIDNAAMTAMDAAMPRWIPVTEKLPEESEGLNWHEEMTIRFTSVFGGDANTGCMEVRNRLQRRMTGNEYLDQYTKDTDWHWSKSWWEPTHWMPIVPLPEQQKYGG